jgi:hypothetical protein
MAVNEATEAYAVLADDLALDVTRPVLNRVFPRRFTRAEAQAVHQLSAAHRDDPLLGAARLQIRQRHDAERHLSRLRRTFGLLPVTVRQICRETVHRSDLEAIGVTLARAVLAPHAHDGN